MFFFNAPATTKIYTLSLHDALPISAPARARSAHRVAPRRRPRPPPASPGARARPPRGDCRRSEEHTSELQSRENLVCRLLLEKKKKLEKDQSTRYNNTTKVNSTVPV